MFKSVYSRRLRPETTVLLKSTGAPSRDAFDFFQVVLSLFLRTLAHVSSNTTRRLG